ncbi:MAG: nitrilase-related carbon-nitrogen hydrolase [Promethearchaeota archaeon]
MKIALVSLNQIWEDKEANKTRCKIFIEKAANNDAEFVIFPEMTITGFSMNINQIAENIENSDTSQFFIEQAFSNKISILFGIVVKDNGKAFNQAIFITSSGAIKCVYSKIHPFSFAGENKYFNSGNSLGIFDYNNLKIGLTICYDLRFPELYQALSKECLIIINIANWPAKRIDHWETLLKARAIENQIFMIGVNRIGLDGNNINYEKSSMIFNSDGIPINPCYSEEELDILEIEPQIAFESRNNFPIKNDRKIELYKRLL